MTGALALPSAPALAQDAVEAAGKYYEVVLENDLVRVLRGAYPPGAKSTMHEHPPSVVVQMTGGMVRFTGVTGQTMDQELTFGRVAMSGGMHSVENIGDKELVVLIIEIKNSASLLQRIFGQ